MNQLIGSRIWLLLILPVAGFAQRAYVGSDRCGFCHPQHLKGFKASVHADRLLPGNTKPAVTGCESCHGPGSEHAQKLVPGSIFAFKNEPAETRSSMCLACHASTHPQLNYRRGEHYRGGVGCDDCHAFTGSQEFHRMSAVDDMMGKAQPDLCYSCHTQRRADFALPSHHPVNEKFMGCTGCHEPHGSFTVRQLRTRHTDAVCVRCHEDHQGPFIFEHPPGRAAGCQACHLPHGSANPKMLTRPQVYFLCLECHTNTPASHDVARAEYRNCTVCHNRVHGSNLSRFLFE